MTDRQTDRQTDGQTDGHLCDRKDRPACMQRGKNESTENNTVTEKKKTANLTLSVARTAAAAAAAQTLFNCSEAVFTKPP